MLFSKPPDTSKREDHGDCSLSRELGAPHAQTNASLQRRRVHVVVITRSENSKEIRRDGIGLQNRKGQPEKDMRVFSLTASGRQG